MVNKKEAVKILESLRAELTELCNDQIAVAGYPEFVKWHLDAETAIQAIFPTKKSHLDRFDSVTFGTQDLLPGENLSGSRKYFLIGMSQADAILRSMMQEIQR